MDKRGYKSEAERRAEIVETAREILSKRGISGTSMTTLAKEIGVSRGTIYHYFEDKNALIEAVIDDYVNDLVESIELWEATREKGDFYRGLHEAILLVKRLSQENSDLRRRFTDTEDAGFYLRYSSRAINKLVETLGYTTIKYYRESYPIEIEHLDETFYVLIAGLVSYVRSHPEADPDVLVRVAAQTLHIPVDG